jgi:hypothetical protein
MYAGLHVKYPLFFQILMKLQFSRQIFEKYSDIKFHENPSSGSWVALAEGDAAKRHDEADSRFSQTCERAQ